MEWQVNVISKPSSEVLLSSSYANIVFYDKGAPFKIKGVYVCVCICTNI